MVLRTRNPRAAKSALRARCALSVLAIAALPTAPALAGIDSFVQQNPDGDNGNDKKDKNDKGKEQNDGDKKEPGKAGKVKLGKKGDAVAPAGAPKEIVKVVKAANEINDKPYQYGGGHGQKKSKGYDCSGAVSYALSGGRFLKDPLDSSGLESWGKKGEGDWITVYANKGHTYVLVGGLRFDTSSAGDGSSQNGPRWREGKAPTKGYEVRHPKGF